MTDLLFLANMNINHSIIRAARIVYRRFYFTGRPPDSGVKPVHIGHMSTNFTSLQENST